MAAHLNSDRIFFGVKEEIQPTNLFIFISFCYLDPIWINISVFLLAALLKLEITVSFFSGLHCQFIQGH